MLHILENGEAFNKEEITDFSKVGAKAIDDHTLVLTLKEPAPYFPDLLKHTTWLPVHPPTIEKFGGMTAQFTKWQRPGNYVGNGAFQLKSWRIQGHVEVERNPHYWDAETVKLNGIRFYPLRIISRRSAPFAMACCTRPISSRPISSTTTRENNRSYQSAHLRWGLLLSLQHHSRAIGQQGSSQSASTRRRP